MDEQINVQAKLSEENYNFIFSNIILSQKEPFTYVSIREEIKKKTLRLDDKMDIAIRKCLVRLREDGFLDMLGSVFSVNQ